MKNQSSKAHNVAKRPKRRSPDWKHQTLERAIRRAFKGRIIETLDHPIIRQLRGQQ